VAAFLKASINRWLLLVEAIAKLAFHPNAQQPTYQGEYRETIRMT